MSDAVGRAKRLREHARSLLRILDDTSGSPVTRNYVDEQIAAADLNVLSAELKWLVKACDMALDQMADISRHRFWPDGFAWQIWIRQLTEIAAYHQLPTGARKDS